MLHQKTLIFDLIFSDSEILSLGFWSCLLFWDAPGVKLGGKMGIKFGNIAHLPPNGYKNLTIWSDMIFNITNLILASFFTIPEYLVHFEAPQESNGVQNGVNLPISSQMVITIYKFGQI